eukprot:TRINITY_DN1983_c0_g1::TRINITY_DN1983_c0_g1_i1::g.22993::m.22993 TRINITY_DN1983_c0_g1::TRINITY_DN1983_c0_g1_i1::g.22993  ORF type:complete len:2853 (+),score=963.98,Peptidase_S74/PF13884.1/1.1e-16,DUF2345/PF10106.4/1.4e+02,DUF2345/PF10106.4/7e+02,DUF2345/PF10106.4/0.14,DUF2345/PF10106.4/1.6e+02,DUF2345/PF10106.4/2,DUF2345/PF10106.4/1.4e+03,DUF2345/PF10106.4/1.7e+02,DUF2345/PF10106.4/3.7,DUF2345/PF10106.4/0.0038,DUF2345/PF10106.4/30,DUF2345/PF10106.4/0.22,DUF2345/PF10106.4/0.0012,DUF2345/PF10106.4
MNSLFFLFISLLPFISAWVTVSPETDGSIQVNIKGTTHIGPWQRNTNQTRDLFVTGNVYIGGSVPDVRSLLQLTGDLEVTTEDDEDGLIKAGDFWAPQGLMQLWASSNGSTIFPSITLSAPGSSSYQNSELLLNATQSGRIRLASYIVAGTVDDVANTSTVALDGYRAWLKLGNMQLHGSNTTITASALPLSLVHDTLMGVRVIGPQTSQLTLEATSTSGAPGSYSLLSSVTNNSLSICRGLSNKTSTCEEVIYFAPSTGTRINSTLTVVGSALISSLFVNGTDISASGNISITPGTSGAVMIDSLRMDDQRIWSTDVTKGLSVDASNVLLTATELLYLNGTKNITARASSIQFRADNKIALQVDGTAGLTVSVPSGPVTISTLSGATWTTLSANLTSNSWLGVQTSTLNLTATTSSFIRTPTLDLGVGSSLTSPNFAISVTPAGLLSLSTASNAALSVTGLTTLATSSLSVTAPVVQYRADTSFTLDTATSSLRVTGLANFTSADLAMSASSSVTVASGSDTAVTAGRDMTLSVARNLDASAVQSILLSSATVSLSSSTAMALTSLGGFNLQVTNLANVSADQLNMNVKTDFNVSTTRLNAVVGSTAALSVGSNMTLSVSENLALSVTGKSSLTFAAGVSTHTPTAFLDASEWLNVTSPLITTTSTNFNSTSHDFNATATATYQVHAGTDITMVSGQDMKLSSASTLDASTQTLTITASNSSTMTVAGAADFSFGSATIEVDGTTNVTTDTLLITASTASYMTSPVVSVDTDQLRVVSHANTSVLSADIFTHATRNTNVTVDSTLALKANVTLLNTTHNVDITAESMHTTVATVSNLTATSVNITTSKQTYVSAGTTKVLLHEHSATAMPEDTVSIMVHSEGSALVDLSDTLTTLVDHFALTAASDVITETDAFVLNAESSVNIVLNQDLTANTSAIAFRLLAGDASGDATASLVVQGNTTMSTLDHLQLTSSNTATVNVENDVLISAGQDFTLLASDLFVNSTYSSEIHTDYLGLSISELLDVTTGEKISLSSGSNLALFSEDRMTLQSTNKLFVDTSALQVTASSADLYLTTANVITDNAQIIATQSARLDVGTTATVTAHDLVLFSESTVQAQTGNMSLNALSNITLSSPIVDILSGTVTLEAPIGGMSVAAATISLHSAGDLTLAGANATSLTTAALSVAVGKAMTLTTGGQLSIITNDLDIASASGLDLHLGNDLNAVVSGAVSLAASGALNVSASDVGLIAASTASLAAGRTSLKLFGGDSNASNSSYYVDAERQNVGIEIMSEGSLKTWAQGNMTVSAESMSILAEQDYFLTAAHVRVVATEAGMQLVAPGVSLGLGISLAESGNTTSSGYFTLFSENDTSITAGSLLNFTSETLNVQTAQDTDLTVGGTLRLHTASDLEMIASDHITALSPLIELHASDALDLFAAQNVTLFSSNTTTLYSKNVLNVTVGSTGILTTTSGPSVLSALSRSETLTTDLTSNIGQDWLTTVANYTYLTSPQITLDTTNLNFTVSENAGLSVADTIELTAGDHVQVTSTTASITTSDSIALDAETLISAASTTLTLTSSDRTVVTVHGDSVWTGSKNMYLTLDGNTELVSGDDTTMNATNIFLNAPETTQVQTSSLILSDDHFELATVLDTQIATGTNMELTAGSWLGLQAGLDAVYIGGSPYDSTDPSKRQAGITVDTPDTLYLLSGLDTLMSSYSAVIDAETTIDMQSINTTVQFGRSFYATTTGASFHLLSTLDGTLGSADLTVGGTVTVSNTDLVLSSSDSILVSATQVLTLTSDIINATTPTFTVQTTDTSLTSSNDILLFASNQVRHTATDIGFTSLQYLELSAGDDLAAYARDSLLLAVGSPSAQTAGTDTLSPVTSALTDLDLPAGSMMLVANEITLSSTDSSKIFTNDSFSVTVPNSISLQSDSLHLYPSSLLEVSAQDITLDALTSLDVYAQQGTVTVGETLAVVAGSSIALTSVDVGVTATSGMTLTAGGEMTLDSAENLTLSTSQALGMTSPEQIVMNTPYLNLQVMNTTTVDTDLMHIRTTDTTIETVNQVTVTADTLSVYMDSTMDLRASHGAVLLNESGAYVHSSGKLEIVSVEDTTMFTSGTLDVESVGGVSVASQEDISLTTDRRITLLNNVTELIMDEWDPVTQNPMVTLTTLGSLLMDIAQDAQLTSQMGYWLAGLNLTLAAGSDINIAATSLNIETADAFTTYTDVIRLQSSDAFEMFAAEDVSISTKVYQLSTFETQSVFSGEDVVMSCGTTFDITSADTTSLLGALSTELLGQEDVLIQSNSLVRIATSTVNVTADYLDTFITNTMSISSGSTDVTVDGDAMVYADTFSLLSAGTVQLYTDTGSLDVSASDLTMLLGQGDANVYVAGSTYVQSTQDVQVIAASGSMVLASATSASLMSADVNVEATSALTVGAASASVSLTDSFALRAGGSVSLFGSSTFNASFATAAGLYASGAMLQLSGPASSSGTSVARLASDGTMYLSSAGTLAQSGSAVNISATDYIRLNGGNMVQRATDDFELSTKGSGIYLSSGSSASTVASITMQSSGTLTAKTSGNVYLSSGNNVQLVASNSATLAGSSVTVEATGVLENYARDGMFTYAGAAYQVVTCGDALIESGSDVNIRACDTNGNINFVGGSSSGTLTVNTDKFTINLPDGATTAAGTLTVGGNVGIAGATPSSTYALDVSGSARVVSLVQTSDMRLKADIVRLSEDDALDMVMKLRGVSFRWKDDVHGSERQYGLLAQEVEAVIPEAVSTDSQGYKSVAYTQLVAHLIEGTHALHRDMQTLQAEKAALQQQNTALEQRVTQLSQQHDSLATLVSQLADRLAALENAAQR